MCRAGAWRAGGGVPRAVPAERGQRGCTRAQHVSNCAQWSCAAQALHRQPVDADGGAPFFEALARCEHAGAVVRALGHARLGVEQSAGDKGGVWAAPCVALRCGH